MWSRALVIVGICLATAGHSAAQAQSAAATADQKHLAELIAKSKGPYTQHADGVWSTPYRGKHLASFTVRIAAAEGGIFFFVDLFDRKSIVLSRNMLVKIVELNSDFDYGKIALTETALLVRLDARAKLLDVEEFNAMEQQAASVADEAYAELKDFVQ